MLGEGRLVGCLGGGLELKVNKDKTRGCFRLTLYARRDGGVVGDFESELL